MAITVPPRFLAKIDQDARLAAAIRTSINLVDQWFTDSKVEFFRDYTDHGPQHLTDVLQSAHELMAEGAIVQLDSSDVSVLVLSVLLHDSAMHLSSAGFHQLVRGSKSSLKVPGFDDERDWQSLWDKFFFAARRWSNAKEIDVFGSKQDDPLTPIATVRDPFEHFDNLQDSDKKLIGEFLRLHHPRLAHQFAVFGIPGIDGVAFHLPELLNADERWRAGMIARSHGLPIRDAYEHCEKRFREFARPDAFLMAVLRIADYIQIQSGRVGRVAERYRWIKSLISRIEYQAHWACAQLASGIHDDPETYSVRFTPLDIKVLLRLRDWSTDFQKELDASWALMGQECRGDKYNKLKLSIRRLNTNLDDSTVFLETNPECRFVPERCEYSVAGPEIIKLLIGPLYENKPEYGVRELLQNAVDAVRELADYERQHGIAASVPGDSPEVEIVVESPDEQGERWLQITDRGIGMSLSTIRDYFLKAGASLRSSQQWAEQHAAETETDIRSRVLRTGKFGIGALAAFLLGDEIEVRTRHVSEVDGYRFRTKVDSGPIQVNIDQPIPIGTTIRVRLSKEANQMLTDPREAHKWDWYCTDHPRVVRRIGLAPSLPQSISVPNVSLTDRDWQWRSVSVGGYDAVHWAKLGFGRSQDIGRLFHNGIRVGDRKYLERDPPPHSPWIQQSRPTLAIYDCDGLMPLDLRRMSVQGDSLPFEDELNRSIARDALAYWLSYPQEILFRSGTGIPPLCHLLQGPSLHFAWSLCRLEPLFAYRDGFGLLTPTALTELAVDRVIACSAEVNSSSIAMVHDGRISNSIVLPESLPRNRNHGFGGTGPPPFCQTNIREVLLSGGWTVEGSVVARALAELHKQQGTRNFKVAPADSDDIVERADLGAIVCSTGVTQNGMDLVEAVLRQSNRKGSSWNLLVASTKPVGTAVVEGTIEKIWREIIRRPTIPWNIADRETVLVHAFRELAAELAWWKRFWDHHPARGR